METFIYFCVDADGAKMSFTSRAVLDTGMIVQDNSGKLFTIVDMDIHRQISVYEDAAEAALERVRPWR